MLERFGMVVPRGLAVLRGVCLSCQGVSCLELQMASSRTYPPVLSRGVVFYSCLTSPSWPFPAHLLNEDVVVMATFSRGINIAPSLGACVMAWFQEGDDFIWILARVGQMFSVTWEQQCPSWSWLVPGRGGCVCCASPEARFQVGVTLSAAPRSAVGHMLGWGTNPWKQRKLLSVVSRGLCVADAACLLPREAGTGMCWWWEGVPCAGSGVCSGRSQAKCLLPFLKLPHH